MDFLDETHYILRDGQLYALRFTEAAGPLLSAPGAWLWRFPYELTPASTVPPAHKRARAFHCQVCGQVLAEPMQEAEFLTLLHNVCPSKEAPDAA